MAHTPHVITITEEPVATYEVQSTPFNFRVFYTVVRKCVTGDTVFPDVFDTLDDALVLAHDEADWEGAEVVVAK